jgi:hypothetical protein
MRQITTDNIRLVKHKVDSMDAYAYGKVYKHIVREVWDQIRDQVWTPSYTIARDTIYANISNRKY